MDSKIFNRIGNIKENDKVAFKKKALVFGFFLAVSCTFWLINALGKYYTTEINYPVRYINSPSKKIEVGNPPDNLTITVRAMGYVIFRHNLRSRYIPISFNVNSFSMNRLTGRDSSSFYLQTIYTRDYIANQLSNEFEILEIKPDTLFFRFANISSRILPVIPAFTYQLEKQMILNNPPLLNPDSILVSGPDFVMDTLSGLKTEETDLGIISRNKEYSVKMKNIRNLHFKVEDISVAFHIEQFTEKTISVPLAIVNMPDNLKIQTFPQSVKLTCQVGLSNFEKLDASYFRANVDYNDIAKADGGRLKVMLLKQPVFIKAVNFTPASVEYLIEK